MMLSTTLLNQTNTHHDLSPLHIHALHPSLLQLSIHRLSNRVEIQSSPNLQYSWKIQDLKPFSVQWHLLSSQELVSKPELQWTATSCVCVKYYYYYHTLLWMSASTWIWWVKFVTCLKTIYHGLDWGSRGDSKFQLSLQYTQGSSYSSVQTGSGTRQVTLIFLKVKWREKALQCKK